MYFVTWFRDFSPLFTRLLLLLLFNMIQHEDKPLLLMLECGGERAGTEHHQCLLCAIYTARNTQHFCTNTYTHTHRYKHKTCTAFSLIRFLVPHPCALSLFFSLALHVYVCDYSTLCFINGRHSIVYVVNWEEGERESYYMYDEKY